MDFLPQRTFTNFNFRKKNSKNKIKLPRIDTAFISFNDYERIKKNAIVTKDEEILQNEFIQKEQETSKFNTISSDKISTGIIRNDGKLILTGDETGKLFIHEIITKNQIRKYSSHNLSITSIDIDSSLVKFITSSRDCSFKYFDMINEKPIKDYKKCHNDSIMSNKFFEDNLILTGSHDKTIKLWDLRSNLLSPEIIFDNSDKICDDICIINDNYFCATGDNNIMLFDIRKNEKGE